jgi:murein DD-endopeptidase MepM/ murein hydrolase activator NlpD
VTRFIAGAAFILGALLASGAEADPLSLRGSFVQGGLVEGRVPDSATVTLDGGPVRVGAGGVFLLGFGRDAKPNATLEIRYANGTSSRRLLSVEQRHYEVQRINGLPAESVAPDAEGLKRIAEDRARVAAARDRQSATLWFRGGFVWPAIGPISGIYGTQRILNGEPRQPHFGVDVAAAIGTPVGAAGDGVVSLAEADMVLTGKTIVIDHGLGLSTIYSHLDAIAVSAGDPVRKGQMIGRVGATGRATGPHLHWGASLFQIPLDPALLVGPMPAASSQ